MGAGHLAIVLALIVETNATTRLAAVAKWQYYLNMRRGFSLAEVIAAIGVIAIAGLAILGVVSHLIAAQSKSGHQVVARMLAEQVLQEATLAGPPLWGLADPSVPQTRSLKLQGATESTDFHYRVTPTVLRAAPATNPMGTLYGLKVEVWWWGAGPEAGRAEHGRTSISAEKVVYIEN